jgi:hypothetical protein
MAKVVFTAEMRATRSSGAAFAKTNPTFERSLPAAPFAV